jgi:PAS domain S-box-containing protein
MAHRIKTRLLLALAAAFLLLVSIVTLAYLSTRSLIAVGDESVAESDVLVGLQETFSTVRSAESAQRGYILTGEMPYRAPYDAAIVQVERHRERLRATGDGSPAIERIDGLIERKMAELDSVLTVYAADGQEAALARVASGEGRLLMDSLQAAVAAAVDDRALRLEAATERSQERARVAVLMVAALAVTGLVALVAMTMALLRYLAERARSEHALAAEADRAAGRAVAAEDRFRDFVEQVKDYAIFRCDRDGYVTSWNEGVERVLGYSEREFIGLAPEAIFVPEDVASGVPEWEFEHAARTGSASDDRWMQRKDGTRFFAAGITTAIRDERGGLTGFTKVMRDQTAWKETEDRLRQSETRYRLVARASREAIWDWNLVTGELDWNDAIEDLFGYPAADARSAEWWHARIHPDDRERTLAAMHEAIDSDAEFWSGDYRFLRADGEYAQVIDRGLIARDESGRACRMLGTMADVTERRRAEEKLAQAQRMEAVGRLAGGIAHDLNNMLTAIVGYSTFVEQGLAGDASARADVRELRRAADRSASLTR